MKTLSISLSPSLSLTLYLTIYLTRTGTVLFSLARNGNAEKSLQKSFPIVLGHQAKVEWGVLEDVLDWFPQMCHWGAI